MDLFDTASEAKELLGIEKGCDVERVVRGGSEELALGGELYTLGQDAKWRPLPNVPFHLDPGAAIVGTDDGFIFTTVEKVANGSITFWTKSAGVWAPVIVKAIPRKWHNLLFLPKSQSVLISGGFSDDGQIVGQIELLNVLSLEVSKLETNKQLELSQHFSVCVNNDTVVFLGGFASDGSVNKEIHFLDLNTREFRKVREYVPFNMQAVRSVVACGGNVLVATGYTMWMFDVKSMIWLEVRLKSFRPAFLVAHENVFTIYDGGLAKQVTAEFADPVVFFDRVAQNNIDMGVYGSKEEDVMTSEIKELDALEDLEKSLESLGKKNGKPVSDDLLDSVLLRKTRCEIARQMLAVNKSEEQTSEASADPEDPLDILKEINEFKETMTKTIEKMERTDQIDLRSLNDYMVKYSLQLVVNSPPDTLEAPHTYEYLYSRSQGISQELVAQEKKVMLLLKEQKVRRKMLGSQYLSHAKLAAKMDQELDAYREITEQIRKKQTECVQTRKTINEKFMKEVFAPLSANAGQKPQEPLAIIERAERVKHQIGVAQRRKDAILNNLSKCMSFLCQEKAKDLPAQEIENHCHALRVRLAELCNWAQESARIIGANDLADKCNIPGLSKLVKSPRPRPIDLAANASTVRSAALRNLVSRNEELVFGIQSCNLPN